MKIAQSISPYVIGVALSLCLAQGQTYSGTTEQNTPGASQTNAAGSPPAEGCHLLPYSGTVPLNQVPYYAAGEEDLRGGMACAFVIDPKLPPFTFHFAGNAENSFGAIEVSEEGGGKVIQTIENETDAGAIVPEKAGRVLSAVDVNFDGFKDLKILNNCGATGNCSYDFYVYDPAKTNFEHNDFLTNLTTPTFDQAKKQVTSSSNSSASDWEKDVYQFEKGKYTLIHQEVSVWDREHHQVKISTYELRDGRMKLVDSTTEAE